MNRHPYLCATRWAAVMVVSALLTACGTTPKKSTIHVPTPSKPGGGYYLDDGPGADAGKNAAAYLDNLADAVPRTEKFHSGANKPYTVFGRNYVPAVNNEPFRQTGIATWYGRKYHGNMTSMGETYDMYAMTAAHTTLPLPSYVRVTNPANMKSVVVRINDRGPFHSERVIDLSYAAAHRLDLARRGSGQVLIERVFAGEAPRATAATVTNTPTVIVPPPSPALAPLLTMPVVITTLAATPAPAAAAPLSPPIAAVSTQIFLQLGAFSSEDNAAIFRDRMARELDWNREPLNVLYADNLWRVRLGPYSSRVEAEAIQARVKISHDFLPAFSKP